MEMDRRGVIGSEKEKLNDKDSVRRAYGGNAFGSKSFKINAVLLYPAERFSNVMVLPEIREPFC